MYTPDDGAGARRPDPEAFDPEAVLERDPRVLLDPHFLCALHADLATSLDADAAAAVLLQMGFLHGLQDAMQALTLANGSRDPGPTKPPLKMRLRIMPAGAAVEVHGSWPDCHEASARLTAADCIGACELSAGYTSGWLSGMLDADLVVQECSCGTEGHAACRFVAREAAVWHAAGGPAAARASAIPFASFRALVQAREARRAIRDVEAEEESTAGIDRDSACVHLWGPVMVVPFGGADEGLRALELLGTDPQAREVSVVIVDLGGAIVDEAFGALALEQIVQTAEAWGAETLFAEASSLAEAVIAELEHPPLLVFKDLEQAVVTAFQIARSQRRLA